MKYTQDYKQGKTIVLPKSIITELETNDLTNSLFVTDIGFYEKAYHHFRERKNGSPQNILIYCIDGEGWLDISNKKQVLKKNQYVIISANTPHKYGSNNQNPWSIYWIHFSGLKSHLFINHPNQKIEINLTSNSRFRARILLFEEIYNNLEIGYGMDNLEYASICLWHMLGSFRYLSQFRKIYEYKQHDKIEKSIHFMRSCMNKKLSLEDLADHCGLSVSQFCLLFKKRTARTPLDYLTHLKIQHASKLLDFSDLRISEIASQTGYSDPFYFSRVFSKVMGLSPRAYRNLKKG
jgi:AraC-like DNA-binding protein/quercetin dioxygenase-like cupin family protein